MGPNLLFDKSTFQALNSAEHSTVRDFFYVGLQPLLADEILADLTKVHRDPSRTGQGEVLRLTQRFLGSGPPVLVDHHTAIARALAGDDPPLTGQFVIADDGNVTHLSRNGERGFVVDLHEVNRELWQWQHGRFSAADRLRAMFWRTGTTGLTVHHFRRALDEAGVRLPPARDPNTAFKIARDQVERPSLRPALIRWLGSSLREAPALAASARLRIQALGVELASPYATFCVQLMLFFEILTRNNLLKWRSTNPVDLRHLFYLPFCQAFASGDKLHKLIAPYFLRHDQTFLPGEQFKADLIRIANVDHRLPWEQRLHHHYLAHPQSIICRAHKLARTLDPSRPPRTRRKLSPAELAEIEAEARDVLSRAKPRPP